MRPCVAAGEAVHRESIALATPSRLGGRTINEPPDLSLIDPFEVLSGDDEGDPEHRGTQRVDDDPILPRYMRCRLGRVEVDVGAVERI